MFAGFGTATQTQTQQPQQPAGGGLFGGLNATQSNTTQPGATGGASIFGSTAQNNPPAATGGGLFGNTGGSLFGNTGAGQQQQQQQQPSTNLFGNTQATQPAAGGGLFGGTNTGQQNTTGGLFSGNAQQGATGGLFNNNPQASTTTSGGLFGNTSTNAAAGSGLFGTSTTTPATTGGLFGSTATNNPGGSSLFGGQATQPPANPMLSQQKPAFSLFGQPAQPQTQPQPATAPSLFGQSIQPSQQQAQSSLLISQPVTGPFGALNASTLGTSTLGNSLFASRATNVPTYQQTDPQSQYVSLLQRIDAVKQAWDPASPQCRFQHFFYNLVEPSQVQLYGRPPNVTNQGLWEKAVRENPDPSCMVPVLAIGLDDLQQRVDAQTKQAANHSERIKELKTRIEALSQRHEVNNTARLRRAAALQMQLMHRVLKVVQHLHLLIPALRSSSIRPEEEALRTALEDIDDEIRRPGGISKMRGKLNEMWALVDAVRAARERNRNEGQVGWAVVDEEGLDHIAQILAEEQAGLAHVTKILQRALQDLAVVQGVQQPEEEDADMLSGSATALRDSLLR
ncbi:nucleoporin complex subunit 54-domain-containing protein [Irpex rosettiformis]|uniref:Nucleoporin complex subunit 54-domain-containing protein n=1 Tax=Irpex rosettiformis TaxID=378272 RepID=A0ACB8U1X2_9APHY|nr:nucleoporin complex subunit 54-domain-containing protein [Irpex rosettiformis]